MISRVLACLVVLFSAGVAAAAPPLAAYGRLPALESVELSPDGQRLAYIAVTGESRRLEVQQLDGRVLASLGVGDHKVRDLDWVGSDYLMIEITDALSTPYTASRREYRRVLGFDLKTKTFAHFLNPEDHRGATSSRLNRGAKVPSVILGDPKTATVSGRPTALVRTINLDGSGSYDLFRVNLGTGAATLHERGSRFAIDFIVAPDGKVMAREEWEDETGRWKLLMRDGAAWREVMSARAPLDPPSLLGFGRDGRSMLVSRLQDGERQLVEVTPEGAVSRLSDDNREPSGTLYDDGIGRLLGVAYRAGDRTDYRFYDPKLEAAWRAVARGFPGQHLSLASWSRDFSRIVVSTEGKSSGVYYLVDTTGRKADIIGEAYPEVPPADVAAQKSITYKAADGLDIPAYLTLPVGREAKNLPLIVLPHGGPQAHDAPGFDWWSQALASRGYAVLQPQFRGSSGFGRKFVEAGHGQWGRKMQTDLSDGVRHLVAQGVIDPKRVCIVGASYGGYAALAGVTLDPGVYRCAVAVAGVSDLPRMLSAEADEDGSAKSSTIRYWSRFMGAAFRQRDQLESLSPARLAARADAPVLLIHGRDDTVVPYAQSTLMEKALKQAGKPVEFVTLAGEDHWLSREATRQRMLNATVTFVEKHNPPR